jgi:FAD/FMN-containing dehydrogenase
VDNVLQFTVVLPNASHVIANKYMHPDLFWALRGGGGPSFGILTSVTYRTHENFPYTAVFYTASADSDESFLSLLELWMEQHNGMADAGWSGVWPVIKPGFFLTFFAQGTPPTNPAANATMEAFFNASRALPGVNVSLAMSKAYPSFQQWNLDNLVNSQNGFGFNYTAASISADPRVAVSSWLLPKNVTEPQNAKKVAGLVANLTVAVN